MSPFELEPSQIVALKEKFATFITSLLLADQTANRMLGHNFDFNKTETTPDGGVDAAISDATETSWIPAGNSAWQFKASNLSEAQCAKELEGAEWAKELIKNGATYVLVLGHQLVHKLIIKREEALFEEAVKQGILKRTKTDRRRIRVYDANKIARWASEYPPLIKSPVFKVPMGPLVYFERWSDSLAHQKIWVEDPARAATKQSIVNFLENPKNMSLRIEGGGGIGKTRLVMETLRNGGRTHLVAYVRDEAELTSEILGHLIDNKRKVILVVDECTRKAHEKIVEGLVTDGTIWLITIGQSDLRSIGGVPTFQVPNMEPANVEQALEKNFPLLWVEARRFTSENCGGNIRMAYVLAEKIQKLGVSQAADLIQKGDIATILSISLPEDQDFLAMSVLGAFDRIGWDGELESEVKILAEFLDKPISEVKLLGQKLQEQGLLEKQGRYRSINPQPLAVYLAAKFWSIHGDNVVKDLVPKLTPSLLSGLFSRAAELGRFEPASSTLNSLLDTTGPFGTLARIEEGDLGEFLVQLAIVSPDKTVDHIVRLVDSTEPQQLKDLTKIRRSLVWALEKLAWNTDTFKRASNTLLKLALSENEQYSNNATGCWVSLFGTVLPATAALPKDRLNYLQTLSNSPNKDIRLLIIDAAERALSTQESISVSAENQKGVVVEPRGSVKNNEEFAEYRKGILNLVSGLANDKNKDVSGRASKMLIDHIYPMLGNDINSKDFEEIIISLSSLYLGDIYREVQRIRSFLSRVNNEQFIKLLDELLDKLPKLSSFDRLKELSQLNSWDIENDGREKFEELLKETLKTNDIYAIIKWLNQDETIIQSGWAIGNALAGTVVDENQILSLFKGVTDTNPSVVAGFLFSKSALENKNSFDQYLDKFPFTDVKPQIRLFLTTRGPLTKNAWKRASKLFNDLMPREIVNNIMPWLKELKVSDVVELLTSMLPRLTEQDYRAIIDLLSMTLRDKDEEQPAGNEDFIWKILMLREQYPLNGHTSWEWCQIAKPFTANKPVELAGLIFKLADEDLLQLLRHSEEREIISLCLKTSPKEVWEIAAEYLKPDHWRMQFAAQDWFINEVPLPILKNWIGNSVDRARKVAQISSTGRAKPSEIMIFLLENFKDDEKIMSTLRSNFVTDSWSGNWSSHLSQRIQQLESWVKNGKDTPQVSKWAEDMIAVLNRQLEQAIQDEEEKKYI